MADDKTPAVKPPEPSPFAEPFKPYGKDSASASEPQVSPDGHVHLSQEDIDARDADA